MLTPKGFEVIDLVFLISLRRSSGVGWVKAVSWDRCQYQILLSLMVRVLTMPNPPALDTAEASSAYPTHCIPPCTTGTGTLLAPMLTCEFDIYTFDAETAGQLCIERHGDLLWPKVCTNALIESL